MCTLTDIQYQPLPALTGIPPVDVFGPFAGRAGSVLCVSGGPIDADNSFIGLCPAAIIEQKNGRTELTAADTITAPLQDPLLFADELISKNSSLAPEDMVFPAGLMGYISYEYRTSIENVPDNNPGIPGLPEVWFALPQIILCFDHTTQAWEAVLAEYSINGRTAPCPLSPADIINAVTSFQPGPLPQTETSRLRSNFSCAEHIDAVKRTKDYIIEGDIYQANISRRFSIPVSGETYPLFREIFKRNPAPFFAYVNCGDHIIMSSSPELLLRVRGTNAVSKPIKGTSPRFKEPEKDEISKSELLASTKDDAELSMIVDLVRNDLGKVCRPGSVRVAHHRELQEYSNVFHTVSTVTGDIKQNVPLSSTIRAIFPGGSITGCPKIRSMEIIDEIETTKRHVYTGSIGYIGLNRNCDLNIAIRTAIVKNSELYFSVGGGIVFDSDPQKEFDETTDKARTWLDAF